MKSGIPFWRYPNFPYLKWWVGRIKRSRRSRRVRVLQSSLCFPQNVKGYSALSYSCPFHLKNISLFAHIVKTEYQLNWLQLTYWVFVIDFIKSLSDVGTAVHYLERVFCIIPVAVWSTCCRIKTSLHVFNVGQGIEKYILLRFYNANYESSITYYNFVHHCGSHHYRSLQCSCTLHQNADIHSHWNKEIHCLHIE